MRVQKFIHHSAIGLAAAELPVVLLIAPALLFPSPVRLFFTLLVLLTWLAHWHLDDRLIPATPLNASILILLTMVGVSLMATFDATWSLGKVSGLLLGILVFWSTTRWVTTADRLALGTVAFLLAGAGLASVGLLGTRWFDKFPPLAVVIARIPRAIRGVPGAEEGFQPNAMAGCLLLFIPVQVALLAISRTAQVAPAVCRGVHRWGITGQGLLLLLTGGTLVLTQSRGAWVGIVAATAAFLTWHSRWTRAVAIAAGGCLVVLAVAMGAQQLFDLGVSQAGPGMSGNVFHRVDLWSRALMAIEDFPFTGMGMNVFRRAMPALYPMSQLPPDIDVAHAHNHLLQAALDLGVPGLVAYSSIWIIAGTLMVSVYRFSKSRSFRTLASGLGAGLIAHFVFSMTDAIPLGSKVGVLFWLTLGLVVSLHRVALATTRLGGSAPDTHRG